MEEKIKRLKLLVESFRTNRELFYDLSEGDIQALEDLLKEYEKLDKDNNDLRRLYRRTAEKLIEKEKEELADYFLAQINEVPTFTVDDDIDYYTEYYRLKEENKQLKEYRKRFVDITDKELKEANYYFMYKYTFRGDELAQYINILLKAVNNSIPKQKIQDITEELIKNNTEDNESVKRFEEMRRNLAPNNDFYKKSYQTSIHKLNAEIVTRKHIINVLQDLLEEKGE